MTTTWISPKIIIGPTATGSYYYNRPRIVEAIWEQINTGSHVLLAAPRRVGKSSVMEFMVEKCPENTKCVFRNIQGIKSAEEFYKRFYELIIFCLSKFDKSRNWFKDWFQGITIEEITLDGVKFGDRKPANYLEEIGKLLPKLQSEKVKIVLFLDELPEVLHNLYKKGKSEEASSILDNLRAWRQDARLKESFCLVLAGSVGIHHVVKNIEGRTSDLNDIKEVDFKPLTYLEAAEYVEWVTQDATVQYNVEIRTYLLSKLHYYLPYFINLMLDEINKTAKQNQQPNITTHSIDTAFDLVVRNNDHFREWKNRLFDYFPSEEAAYMNEVLTHIAHKDTIDKRKLYDLATKYNKKNSYIDLMDGLEKDGYITEQDQQYVFVSPFLSAFWKRNNPVYDGE
ncbi:AAA family ATPase [Dyadobacter sp. 32]|uniref:AAA family ATPase n=1 Tax=Dyadobacter sp. 32 TaxID=538966 RepID=UPI0011EE0A0E